MNLGGGAEVEELPKPEFTDHANSADIFTIFFYYIGSTGA